MSAIDRIVRKAAWRLLANDLLARTAWTLTLAAAVLVVLLGLERLAQVAIPWREAMLGAAAGAVVLAVAWSLLTRPDRQRVALEVDERAELRESLSTALLVRGRSDGWSRAVVETAEQRAAQVDLRRAIPLSAPNHWFAPAAAGAALLLAWLAVPTLSGERRSSETERQVRQVLAEQRENQKKLDELLKNVSVDLGDERKDLEADLPDGARTREDVQRAMVKKLTSLTEKLQAERNSLEAQRADALKRELSKLNKPGEGPMSEMAEKLSKGDFSGAKKALEDLKKKMESGGLSEEQKKQMQDQLQDLAQQLEKMSQAQEQMKEAMKQAGLSEEQIQQAMDNPESLKQALEQMQNLTPQQRQQLMDMAMKMGACQQCQGMGNMMGQMAMGQMDPNAMGQLAGMMGAMEMLQQDLELMDAAMAEAMLQLAQLSDSMCEGGGQGMGMQASIGQWKPGDSSEFGSGSGGAGKGFGMNTADDPFDFETRAERAKSKTQAGPIIASMMVDGPQISGESRAQFAEAAAAAEHNASEAIDNLVVPRELQDAVKSYFGTLQEQGK